MYKLKNKIFSGIYKISLIEDGIKFEIEDSIVLKGIETFQLFTNQEKLDVLKILNKYHIDGEYQPTSVSITKISEETINVDKIFLVYDKSINQLVAFSIKSSNKNYFFIRFSDELNLVKKNEYEKLISNIQDVKTEEI